MDHTTANIASEISPVKRGISFIFYVIFIGINFSIFTFFALIWVGMLSFSNIIPWEGWVAIAIWGLLLTFLILSLFRKMLGIVYLSIEAIVIIVFTALNENYGLGFFGLLCLLSVLVPYLFYLRNPRPNLK